MPANISLRSDFDAQQLRVLAYLCKDARQSHRLLSLAAVYNGMIRGEAATIGGTDRQTAQCPWMETASPGNHRSDRPKARHALTIKPEHLLGAEHNDRTSQ